jgi:hypothetical protein
VVTIIALLENVNNYVIGSIKSLWAILIFQLTVWLIVLSCPPINYKIGIFGHRGYIFIKGEQDVKFNIDSNNILIHPQLLSRTSMQRNHREQFFK